MTTDITELAQSLKRRAASANEFGEGLFFIKADDVLALVEVLEKAQRRIADLESRTVTVKLPDYRDTYKFPFADEVEHQVRLALELFSSAAGVKVEAE